MEYTRTGGREVASGSPTVIFTSTSRISSPLDDTAKAWRDLGAAQCRIQDLEVFVKDLAQMWFDGKLAGAHSEVQALGVAAHQFLNLLGRGLNARHGT